MALTVYEHPLNEKVRLLMRLELIFNEIEHCKDISQMANIQPFFKFLFDCIEVLERNDIRPTLSYYLDELERNLLRWASHPEIHDESLQLKLKEAVNLQAELANMNKACQKLKDDKFLASLRQRFGIAGGTCDFDLPQLHYWARKPLAQRQNDLDIWLGEIAPLQQALNFSLLFLRANSPFISKSVDNGFYQDNCDETVSLLRVKYDMSLGVFPTISGSRHRYSITFMAPDCTSVKKVVNDTIKFQLATC